MKNNKWFIPILAIFILFCSSCNNALNNQFEKALDKDEAAEKTATLYFSINGSSSRNILPDTSLANFSDFVLTGTVGDSEVQSLGSWESAQAMTAGSVTVAPGVWNLILTAKKGTDNFSATATVTLEDGGSAVASFVLASAETTGVANITLRYPKNTDIITYKMSTGFETLIGYLYLDDKVDRINEIINEIFGGYYEKDN